MNQEYRADPQPSQADPGAPGREAPPTDPLVDAAAPAAQLHGRLVRLAAAADHEAAELAHVRATLATIEDQVATLVSRLVAATAFEPLDARLAELMARVDSSESQLAVVHEALAKLGRTQYKANALGEAQDERVAVALGVLQGLATRRDETRAADAQAVQATLAEARAEGRAALVADLLPALDGLESALGSGRSLVARRRAALVAQAARLAEAARLAQAAQAADSARAGRGAASGWRSWLAGLFGGSGSTSRRTALAKPGRSEQALTVVPRPSPSVPVPVPDPTVDALAAWLEGLALVHDRFRALLAAEGVQSFAPEGELFDAHWHVAVEAAARDGVPPGTVIDVVRPGYRQGSRIIRYAEVRVARAGAASTGPPSAPDPAATAGGPAAAPAAREAGVDALPTDALPIRATWATGGTDEVATADDSTLGRMLTLDESEGDEAGGWA